MARIIKSLIISNRNCDIDDKIESTVAKLRNNIDFTNEELTTRVKTIIEDVKRDGDSAVVNYTKKFDGIHLKSLMVTDKEFKEAYLKVTKKQIQSIFLMKQRLTRNERMLFKCLGDGVKKRLSFAGVSLSKQIRPIDSVGYYIPGGNAKYPSTAVMCGVPAKIAGVRRIVAISPPMKDGTVDPLTLVAAHICGVDEFYKIGGAQGIAALAYGTSSIRKVSKLVGPGGIFVTIAKTLASKHVSTDMIAGPTELLIYADSDADPKYVALDLISQAEHSYDTLCGLITTSKSLAEKVSEELECFLDVDENEKIFEKENANRNDNENRNQKKKNKNKKEGRIWRSEIVKKSLQQNGFIVICNNASSAIKFINELAPEHLEIMTNNATEVSRKITSAGLVLLGKYAPSSASDYCLGSNHVMPTLGFAKSKASLSVLDFIKVVNTLEVTRQGLKNVEPFLKEITSAEGLLNHYEAVKERTRK
jgi:histidinol dehydrogenase